MRPFLAAAALTLLSALPATAMTPQIPLARPSYTCDEGALSRVALQPSPAACCDFKLKCPQYLSTEGFDRPRPRNRT